MKFFWIAQSIANNSIMWDKITTSPKHLAVVANVFGIGIVLNSNSFTSPIVGIAFTILYILTSGLITTILLKKLTVIQSGLRLFFGILLFHYILSFSGALFIVLFRLPLFVMDIIVLVLPWLLVVFSVLLGKEDDHKTENNIVNNTIVGVHLPRWVVFFIVIIIITALGILLKARTGESIQSPWEVVPSVYFALTFFLAFLVFWATFSRLRWQILLGLIVLFSLFAHSHLAIIYKAGYGGDKWRHLGIERQILRGELLQPSLLDRPIAMEKVGPFVVPTVLVSGNKNSYASQWAATVMYSRYFQVDVFWIDHFLVILLWSLFIPLLFFQFGRHLFSREPLAGLLCAASSLLFYQLITYGSFSSPASYGHIYFLLALLIFVHLRKHKLYTLIFILVALTVVMYFNYILTLILWCAFLLGYLLFQNTPLFWKRFSGVRPGIIGVAIILLISFGIPLLDLLYSNVFQLGVTVNNEKLSLHSITTTFLKWLQTTSGISFWDSSNRFGQSSIFFGLQGNHYPFNAPFTLLLANYSLILFLVIGYRHIKQKDKTWFKLFSLIAFSLYIILYINSTFFSSGARPISNRVDLPLFLLLVPIIGLGVHRIYLAASNRYVAAILLSIAMALIFSFSYRINPTERNVTISEVNAMKSLFTEMRNFGLENNRCVIADPWILLALQAVSGNKVIGGGFPIEREFSQPLLTPLLLTMQQNPVRSIVDDAMSITNANRCYYVTENRWILDLSEPLKNRLLHLAPYEKLDDVYIFRFDKN